MVRTPQQEQGPSPPTTRAGPGGRYWVRIALGSLLLAAIALPFFSLMVAVEQRAPSVLSLDVKIADRLNELANDNAFLLETSLFLTKLGGTEVAVAVFLVLIAILWAADCRRLTSYVVVTALGLALLIPASKALVNRPRPLLDAPVTDLPGNASFPSGHAATAVVLFGCLAVVALWQAPPTWVRRTVVALAVALSIAIGLTRLMLGVHYVSDVIAGWSFGAAWLAITTVALHRRRPEAPSRTTAPVGKAPSRQTGTQRAATGLALLAAWGSVVLVLVAAGLVITGPLATTSIARMDTHVAQLMVESRSDLMTGLATVGSSPANVVVAVTAALAAASVLALVSHSCRSSFFLIMSLGGASSAYLVSSRIVERMRPDVVDLTSPALPEAASWPSGHVAAAVTLYGALAVLLAPTRRSAMCAVGVVIVLAVTVVGGSRVYIAAHYASDVLGGAALGAVWLIICVRLLEPGSASAHRQRPPADLMVRPLPNLERALR